MYVLHISCNEEQGQGEGEGEGWRVINVHTRHIARATPCDKGVARSRVASRGVGEGEGVSDACKSRTTRAHGRRLSVRTRSLRFFAVPLPAFALRLVRLVSNTSGWWVV